MNKKQPISFTVAVYCIFLYVNGMTSIFFAAAALVLSLHSLTERSLLRYYRAKP